MNAEDVPFFPPFDRRTFSLEALLARADKAGRASWKDIPRLPDPTGIYVVNLCGPDQPKFLSHAGRAQHAVVLDPVQLDRRWRRIVSVTPTNIIYVGRGGSLPIRIAQLIRFGLGKAANHVGGQRMWQIDRIQSCALMAQTCPAGREQGFENEFLDRFRLDHHDWPVANDTGPQGPDRWWPTESVP